MQRPFCWRIGSPNLSRVRNLARDRGSNGGGQRTEAERERAREERERRRAQRGAKSPSPPPLPLPSEPALPTDVSHASEQAASEQASTQVEQPHEQTEPTEPILEPAEPIHELAEPIHEPAEPTHEPAEPTHVQAEPANVQVESPHMHTEPPHAHADPASASQRKPADLPRPDRRPASPTYVPIAAPSAKRTRGIGKRIAILLAAVVLIGALVFAVVLISHHSARQKIPPIPKIVKIVIPEGFTRAQIAVLSHQDGLSGSYLLPSKRSSEIDLEHYGAPASTPSLEGFLFPATYEMYVGAQASQLVSEQLAAFDENFGGSEIRRALVLGITPYQLLTVASIIEREAAIPHDRRLVAAVIYNRLRLNMTLGIDSTLRYALHNFTTPLTEAELHSNSPYNTRIHRGLPPTPISNPGAAAIQAAAHPAHVSYLYYVAGADGCGEQVFSTSYAQFEKNAAAYREAIEKNGGRVPACKKG